MDNLTTLKRELSERQAEYNDLLDLSEDAVCDLYNVDTKSEAIKIFQEQIGSLIKEIDNIQESNLDPDAEMEQRMYHFAFPTERAFWAYKGC
jgi:hypothetical protein